MVYIRVICNCLYRTGWPSGNCLVLCSGDVRSNLGWNTAYPDWCFACFYFVSPSRIHDTFQSNKCSYGGKKGWRFDVNQEKKIGIVGVGVQLGPHGAAATNRRIVPAPGVYDDGEIGGMIGKGNRSTRRKLAPVPLCPLQTPMCCPDANPSG
jgi:hypothetical protein